MNGYGVYRLEIAKVVKSQDNKMNDPVMQDEGQGDTVTTYYRKQ